MAGASGPVTRRRALTGAAGAVGVVASGLGLAACASSPAQASQSAAPQPTSQVLTINFQLWTPAVPVNKTSLTLIQQFVDQSFNAKTKGVYAKWSGSQGSESTIVSEVLAGSASAPYVVASCCGDWPIIQPFLAQLDPFFKSDNINVSTTWQPGQLSRFQDANGNTYGLPEDAASDAYLYRQDILDGLGLPYPSPTWTAAEAASLWAACSGKLSNGAWRYGVGAPFSAGATEGLPTVVSGFGGQFQSADRTQLLMDSPQAIAAGEYWMNMVWNRVATGGDGSPVPGIFNGTCVFTTGAEPTIIDAVEQLGDKAKWDFLPWPVFPAHSVGKLHDNFYGMLASAPQQEVAWELLKWIAVGPDWQRFYMQLALAPPGQASLLQEWYTIMEATAPILKGKQLQYWGSATLAGQGVYDYEFMQYAPSQAANVVTGWFGKVWNQTVSVTEGFTQMTQQVNALEAQAAAAASKLVTNSKAFPTNGPAIAPAFTGL